MKNGYNIDNLLKINGAEGAENFGKIPHFKENTPPLFRGHLKQGGGVFSQEIPLICSFFLKVFLCFSYKLKICVTGIYVFSRFRAKLRRFTGIYVHIYTGKPLYISLKYIA